MTNKKGQKRDRNANKHAIKEKQLSIFQGLYVRAISLKNKVT